MKTFNDNIKCWLLPILVTMIFILVGASLSYGYQSKTSSLKQKVKTVIVKTPQGSKALGPQPEPPDKPAKGSKALGPQPEPPDRK